MTDGAEVLVHISTSTTRREEQVYHALADAYLAFEVYSSDRPGISGRKSVCDDGVKEDAPLRSSPNSEISLHDNVSKDSFGTFPSGLQNAGIMVSLDDVGSFSNDSSIEQVSSGQTSRMIQLERVEAQWKSRMTGSGSSAKRVHRRSPQEAYGVDFFGDTQLAYQALESQLDADSLDLSFISESTSHPPAHVTLSDTSESEGAQLQLESRSQHVHDQLSSSAAHTTDEYQTEAFSSKSPRLDALSKKASQPGTDEHDNETGFQNELAGSSLVVLPPAPNVSLRSPAARPSHLTSFLTILKQQNPGRFSCEEEYRTLELDERGHWLLRCGTWPINLQSRFWTAMTGHVCSGRVGWDVTLHREQDDACELAIVRVYCWVEVLEHIWILLWLCSEGKIHAPGVTLQWVDANDAVVLKAIQ